MAVSTTTAGKDKAALEASSTWGGPAPTVAGSGPVGTSTGTVSRGYKEEMEDFAFCIRTGTEAGSRRTSKGKTEQRLPRCHGEVAMADAIVALTSHLPRRQQRSKRDHLQGRMVRRHQG